MLKQQALENQQQTAIPLHPNRSGNGLWPNRRYTHVCFAQAIPPETLTGTGLSRSTATCRCSHRPGVILPFQHCSGTRITILYSE